MNLRIKKTFLFAHDGIRVVEYVAGTEVETDDEELVKVSTDEKWAELVGHQDAAKTPKAKDKAPENKIIASDPEQA